MPLCVLCKRYHRFKYVYAEGNRLHFCDAYPDGKGIPDAVYWVGHFNPKPGDRGLQFEARSDVDENRVQRYRELCANEDERYKDYKSYDEKQYSI